MNNMETPPSWRKGQTIFNFLEWLKEEKQVPGNQSARMADPFHLSDEMMDEYYNEFLALQKPKKRWT